jgi:hypothetical protein
MTLKNVFICYRRDDAEGYAGRLYDRLNSRFPGRVFMDVTGIGPGADFTRVIRDRVGACHALVAVIGKEWLMIADENKRRRLFRDDDYVRHEIGTALSRNIPVIPVLVRDAKMPSAEALPPDLAQLSFRNAIEITDPDFDHDVGRLIHGLEYLFGEQGALLPPPPKTGGHGCLMVAIGLVLGGVGIFLLLIIIGALMKSCENPPGPTPIYSPAPSAEPSAPAPVETGFKPVGRWNYQIGNTTPGQLDLKDDRTYKVTNEEYANLRGTWEYSAVDGKLTLEGFSEDEETAHAAEITIDRQSGNQFLGQITIEGVTSEFRLSPR